MNFRTSASTSSASACVRTPITYNHGFTPVIIPTAVWDSNSVSQS